MRNFRKPGQEEIDRINRLQRERFNRSVHLFEPPLPEGVPARLEQIVAAAAISEGDFVLDVGTGTGILIPLIQKYLPARIYACDLSKAMLGQLEKKYSGVETFQEDVRDLNLPADTIDAVLVNACYPNIADKAGAFRNIARMMKPAGRLVISHPLGKAFVDKLRVDASYPLDDFPSSADALSLFNPLGLEVELLVDEPALYILTLLKC